MLASRFEPGRAMTFIFGIDQLEVSGRGKMIGVLSRFDPIQDFDEQSLIPGQIMINSSIIGQAFFVLVPRGFGSEILANELSFMSPERMATLAGATNFGDVAENCSSSEDDGCLKPEWGLKLILVTGCEGHTQKNAGDCQRCQRNEGKLRSSLRLHFEKKWSTDFSHVLSVRLFDRN